MRKANEIANVLKKLVQEHEFVDVGKGAEKQLGVNGSTLHAALASLKAGGYSVIPIAIRQKDTDKVTVFKVLSKEGPGNPEIHNAIERGQVKSVA